MTSLMMSFSLHTSKTHFQEYSRGFLTPDYEIWHDGENRGDQLMYDIEIENKVSIHTIYDDVTILSRHASSRQRTIFSESYDLSQWNLAIRIQFYFLSAMACCSET